MHCGLGSVTVMSVFETACNKCHHGMQMSLGLVVTSPCLMTTTTRFIPSFEDSHGLVRPRAFPARPAISCARPFWPQRTASTDRTFGIPNPCCPEGTPGESSAIGRCSGSGRHAVGIWKVRRAYMCESGGNGLWTYVADTPGDRALLTSGRSLVRLTFDAYSFEDTSACDMARGDNFLERSKG